MSETYNSDELVHWGIPGKHKYIAKIGEGINAKYFYTQQQIDAYKNGLKGKVNNAAQNVQKKIPTANQVKQTAKRVGQQSVASVRQTASNIAKNAPGAANRAAMATRNAAVTAAGAALVNTKAGSKAIARQRNASAAAGDTATLKRLNSFEKYRASNVKANVKQRINNNEYVKAAKATGEAAKAVGKAGKAAYQFAKTPYGKQVIKEAATNAVKQSKAGRMASAAKEKAASASRKATETAIKFELANTKTGQYTLDQAKKQAKDNAQWARDNANEKYQKDSNQKNSLADRVLRGKPKYDTVARAKAEREYQQRLNDINKREAKELNSYADIEKYNVKNAAKRAVQNTKAAGYRTMNKAKAAGRDVVNSAKQAVENKAMSVVRNDAHNKSFDPPIYTERTYTSTNTLSNRPTTVKKKKI